MTQLNKISIPQPCHQSWQQMTLVNDGRHCQHCSKTVADFTTMTNDEVINYLSANNNVCGRLGEQQLNNVNNKLLLENMPEASRIKGWAMAAGLIGSLFFYKANAQTKPATIQTSVNTNQPTRETAMLGKIAAPYLVKTNELKGWVTDEQGLAIPGAIVKIPESNLSAITGNDGSFHIQVPASAKQFTVSYIGYNTEIIDINNYMAYEVKLNHPEILGGIMVARPPFFKRVYYKFIKEPINRLF